MSERRPRRKAQGMPPNDRALLVLEALGLEPVGATKLAATVGLERSGVTSLADRGLAERVPYKGWRRK